MSWRRVATRWARLVPPTLVVAALSPLMAVSPAGAATGTYPPIIGSGREAPQTCPSTTPSSSLPPSRVAILEHAVTTFVGKRLDGVGECGNGLLVMLSPGSEALARRVRVRFGSSVAQISVGLTSWDGRPGRSPLCGSLPTSSPQPLGYSVTLDLRPPMVRSGENLQGTVVFHNPGTGRVRVDSVEPVEIVITRPGTRRVVGVYSGGIAGTGYAPPLGPGQSKAVRIVGGTARCDGGLGSALPPGRYDATGEFSGPGVTGVGDIPSYFTPMVPIKVLPSEETRARAGSHDVARPSSHSSRPPYASMDTSGFQYSRYRQSRPSRSSKRQT